MPLFTSPGDKHAWRCSHCKKISTESLDAGLCLEGQEHRWVELVEPFDGQKTLIRFKDLVVEVLHKDKRIVEARLTRLRNLERRSIAVLTECEVKNIAVTQSVADFEWEHPE
jgi:hypothetical protein